jgi:hypothetical protein
MNTNEMVVNLLQAHCGSPSFIYRYPEDVEKRACVDRVLDWDFGNVGRGVGK